MENIPKTKSIEVNDLYKSCQFCARCSTAANSDIYLTSNCKKKQQSENWDFSSQCLARTEAHPPPYPRNEFKKRKERGGTKPSGDFTIRRYPVPNKI